MTLQDKIKSIRDTLNVDFVKPSTEMVEGFITALNENTQAFDYLNITRGLTRETIEWFKLGYNESKNAISIPIYKRGELVNIKYRYLNPKAPIKYSQEKGAEVWLFNEQGLDKAKEKGGILIVEGEIDAMTAWQNGFKNVISPASGKDSYGIWLELLETIPRVYISYDNDKPGKIASMDLADRIGLDKTYEVLYPEGIKDANDFFKQYGSDDYKNLIRKAIPFYRHTYQDLSSVIKELKTKGDNRLELETLPFIKLGEDWMVVVSGTSGVGKTSVVMNIANELSGKDIPTLVLPYERGIKTVGSRFIQIKLDKTEDELMLFTDDEWDKHTDELLGLPLYFSMPSSSDISEIVVKGKKYLNIKVVIIDHLDYSIMTERGVNEVAEMKKVLQNWKTLAIENNIIFIVVHHINKAVYNGSVIKKPRKEDLKGGSASYQVPEAVVMLSEPEEGQIEIDVVKNKGKESSVVREFDKATGILKGEIKTEEQKAQDDFDAF